MATKGNLEVILCDGKLRDVEWLGDQDPFCVLELGSQKFKTKVCTDGGADPVFNERFTFLKVGPGTGADTLVVRVWDKNMFNDKEIGAAGVNMARVYAAGCEELRVPLSTHKGKPAGELRMMFIFKATGPAASVSPPMTPPAAAYSNTGLLPTYSAAGTSPLSYHAAADSFMRAPGPLVPQPSFHAQPSFSPSSFTGCSSGNFPNSSPAAPSSPNYTPFPATVAAAPAGPPSSVPIPPQPLPFGGVAAPTPAPYTLSQMAAPGSYHAAATPVASPYSSTAAGPAAALGPYPGSAAVALGPYLGSAAAAPGPYIAAAPVAAAAHGPYPAAYPTEALRPAQWLGPYHHCAPQTIPGMGQFSNPTQEGAFGLPSC